MRRFIIMIAVGLLAAMFASSASAHTAVHDEFVAAATGELYLGDGFSIDSLGYRGEEELLADTAQDQSTCAAVAYNLRPAGSGFSERDVAELSAAEYGGPEHEECYAAVKQGLANTDPEAMKAGQSPIYKQAMKLDRKGKKGVRCTPKFCVFKVEGRSEKGGHKWRKIKVRRGKSVVVWSLASRTQVQGKWRPAGAPFGTGMGGCVNHMAQPFERVTTLKFKFRFSYGKPGKPVEKPNTPGPGGDGSSPPPVEPSPGADNQQPGPSTPPPNIPPGGGTGDGGCNNPDGTPCSN